MQYYKMICEQPEEKEALVLNDKSYTYEDLQLLASKRAKVLLSKETSKIHIIRKEHILEQLIDFLACNAVGIIPLIMPNDCKITKEEVWQLAQNELEKIDKKTDTTKVCMAVMTSGTTGIPKIYFRTYESWAGFFGVQNDIFQVTKDSRLFTQGSLAFTGNLNLYLAQFYAGGTVIALEAFWPKSWQQAIEKYHANAIYLIPSKLMLLPKVQKEPYKEIRMILSGSQSLGIEDAKALKASGVDYPLAMSMNAEEKAATGLMWTAFQMDGVVWNDDGTFNKDAIMDALNYYQEVLDADLVAPEDKTASGMEAYMRICSGTASFLVGPTMFVSKTQNPDDSAVVGQVEPILAPGKDGTAKKTMALPEALGVTSASENKEAAQKFVEWYTSADMQKELNETNSAIPTRNSVLEELINDDKIQNAGAMLEEAKLISSPFPDGIPSYYAEMSNAMYNAINKMALGELTAEEAFKEMDTKITELAGQK